jgi:predicted alpha/beta superfamily hydrolase
MNRLSLAAVLFASTVSASPAVHIGKLDVVHFKSRALNAVRTVRVWDEYLTFLVEEVIPFVDGKYPTRREPEARGFGGSSFGAVSAFYAIMARPGVFGRVLLESPSVGVGNSVLLDRARTFSNWPERIVMGVGTGEGRGGRPSGAFQTLVDLLRGAGLGEDRLKVVVQDGGRHNEESWAARLPDSLAFLFSSSDRRQSE